MGKTIGIKLADGSFYPIIESGVAGSKKLDLTTVRDDQTEVHVDLFSANNPEMKWADYIGTLQLGNLEPSPSGNVDISLLLSIDEEDTLSAEISDPQTGDRSVKQIPQISTAKMTKVTPDFALIPEEPVSEAAPAAQDIPDAVPAAQVQNDEPAAQVPNDEPDEFAAVVGELPDFDFDLTELLSPDEDAADQQDESETTEPAAQVRSDEPVTEEGAAEDDAALVEDEFTFLDEAIDEESADLPDDIDIDLSNLDFDLQDDEVVDELASTDALTPESETEEIATITDDDFAFLDEITEAEPVVEPVADLNELIEADAQAEIKENGETVTGRTLSDGEVDSLTKLFDEVKATNDEVDAVAANETEKNKHIRAAVVTCLVCALLCVGALIVVCFFLPSITNSTANNSPVTEVIEVKTQVVETIPDPAPPIEETHLEDVLVEPVPTQDSVALSVPEEIKPEVPLDSVALPEPPVPVIHRVKWGDTLWKLAGTYYGDPWLFRRIAQYNGITDPTHLVSGTDLVIPPR
jgi:nucleoid-associated protein YgaU